MIVVLVLVLLAHGRTGRPIFAHLQSRHGRRYGRSAGGRKRILKGRLTRGAGRRRRGRGRR